MNREEVLRKIEEIDPEGEIPDETVEQLIQAMTETVEPKQIKKNFYDLRDELEQETDWRKRASLAARMVSMNLE